MELKNQKVVLAKRPDGVPKESDFELVDETVAELSDDEVVVAVEHLSIDAFIRTTLNVDGLHGQAELGAPIIALGTGRCRCTDSRRPYSRPGRTHTVSAHRRSHRFR